MMKSSSGLYRRVGIAVVLVLVFCVFVARVVRRRTLSRRASVASVTPGTTQSPVNPSQLQPTPDTSPIQKVTIIDGNRQIVLDETGIVRGMDDAPDEFRRLVADAIKNERVGTSAALSALVGKPGTSKSVGNSNASFKVSGPVGTIVESNKPLFRWQALKGAESYVVEVYDSKSKVVATSEPVNVTSWTPLNPLPRGGRFNWQVTATKEAVEIKSPARPAVESDFKILDQAKANEIAAAKKSYAGTFLTRGILFAREGLLDDAEREFVFLLEQNKESAVVQKWLKQIKALRKK